MNNEPKDKQTENAAAVEGKQKENALTEDLANEKPFAERLRKPTDIFERPLTGSKGRHGSGDNSKASTVSEHSPKGGIGDGTGRML